MGCDIHLHTEVKINGVWHHYGSPSVNRSYKVFAKMAGIRNHDNEIEPISQPRGLPEDCSELTLFDHDLWGGDGHSCSYLTAEEITTLYGFIDKELKLLDKFMGWFPTNFGYLFGNNFDSFTKYPEENPEGLEDIRFVFWFDC